MKNVVKVAVLLTFLVFLLHGRVGYAEMSFNDALVDAADRNASSTVTQLLRSSYPVDSKGKFGVTALMRAAYHGNMEIAQALLNLGANPNAVDIGGATALHLASREGHSDMVNLLLKYKAYVDLADNEGWTALMRASLADKVDIVRILISAGADVNAVNKTKESPLFHAVQRKNIAVAKMLIDNGADPTQVNALGFSVMEAAKRKRNEKLEALIQTALDRKDGKAVDSRLAQNLPASMHNKNFKLEVREPTEQEQLKLGGDNQRSAQRNLEIAKRMDSVLRSKETESMIAEAEDENPELGDEAEIAEADLPPTLEPLGQSKDLREVADTPWSSEKNEEYVDLEEDEEVVKPAPAPKAKKEVKVAKAEPTKPSKPVPLSMQKKVAATQKAESKPAPAVAANKKTSGSGVDIPKIEPYEVAEVSEVNPEPTLRPGKPVADTPWLNESGQKDLIAKLRELEKDIGLPAPKSMEKKDSDEQKTEVASSVSPSTEPEAYKQKSATSVPAQSPEMPSDAVVREGLPWVAPASTPAKSSASATAAKQEETEVADEELEDELLQVAMAEKNKPAKAETKPAASKIAPHSFSDVEQTDEDVPPENVRNTDIVPVNESEGWAENQEEVDGRPWLTPNELKDNVPSRIAMEDEKARLSHASGLSDRSVEMELDESEESASEKPVPVAPAKPASTEAPKSLAAKPVAQPAAVAKAPTTPPPAAPAPVQIAKNESAPEPIVPSSLMNKKQEYEREEVETKNIVPPKDLEETEMQNNSIKSERAAVEVSEAIRVPLSQSSKENVKVEPASPGQQVQPLKVPAGFFPSSKEKSKSYWLEIRKFESEETAISYFDSVTAREKLYLRMRLITPAKKTRDKQVSLRIGTFDSSEEAADMCLTFRTNELQCAIVRDEGQSAPAKTAHPFRFGYERGTYQNEYAYASPSAGGEYFWVQLGTFHNEFEAIGHWQNLSRSHADVLSNLKVNLTTPQRSSSASQSLRLRAGPFMAKAEANETCRALKQRHVSCLAVSGK